MKYSIKQNVGLIIGGLVMIQIGRWMPIRLVALFLMVFGVTCELWGVVNLGEHLINFFKNLVSKNRLKK